LHRRALAGKRLSLDEGQSWLGAAGAALSPIAPDEQWRGLNLDSQTLDRVPLHELVTLLADLSPDVSRALWDFNRSCNPGWEIKAFRPGTETVDKQAQAALDAFIDLLSDLYGSVDIVFNRLFTGAFLRGAFVAELVLDEQGRLPVDLATPDPYAIRFKRVTDPARGQIWQMGQNQRGQWVALDRPTIRYVPVDPLPGSPYGRSLVAPAVFPTLFLIGLLHDLRRVVAQQGYPRLDISISPEMIKQFAPPEVATDHQALVDWLAGTISDVQDSLAALEPDDAYVHLDAVKMNRPVGTVDSSSLGAVEGLIKALERMAVRALKTMPLMMGTTDGVSEANANRQWEMYAAGVKSLQHLCETLLGRLFRLSLQAQGIDAKVVVRFAELRAAELLRDAQVAGLNNANAVTAYNQGWISQDEAAEKAVGHKADVPEPRTSGASSNATGPLMAAQADPGSERGVFTNGHTVNGHHAHAT
jgi:hypothetical protein